MCGICGIFGDATRGDLDAMVAAMRHRGPDDKGTFREGMAAFGMARLAVIDLSAAAHQPMETPDGAIRIVYNGETFNFRSERTLLEAKGHSFRSSSDTEVVLRMYEHYGDDFVARLRGMFALAIHDRRPGPGRERLLLARDPFGIKPLLYARSGDALLFASEMKALLASGAVPRAVDPESLRLLLTFGSVVQPRTIVDGVRMLPPGSRMLVEGGSARIERYWEPATGRVAEVGKMDEREVASALRAALEESVRLQMVSDVPVGVFLSGGVDSTLMAALACRESPHALRSYSVGFEADGARFDESGDAEKIARFLGTNHTRVVVTGAEVRDRLAHIASALDQPSVDGVNSYFVSQAARRGVTVSISGTGGDELFAGYPWFIYMAVSERREREQPVRAMLRRAAAAAASQSVLDPLAAGKWGAKIDALRSGAGFFRRYARITRIFGVDGCAAMLSPSLRERARIGRDPARDTAASDVLPGAPTVERVTGICLRGYTQNQLLRDIDAVSMAHSLEVRVPFLDTAVADLALSIPSGMKLGSAEMLPDPLYRPYSETGAKGILLKAGAGLLPEGIGGQAKRGFRLPFESWLDGSLREPMNELLSHDTIRKRGLFDAEAVSRMQGDYLAGRVSWTRPWLLMIVEMWCREVLDGKRLPEGRDG